LQGKSGAGTHLPSNVVCTTIIYDVTAGRAFKIIPLIARQYIKFEVVGGCDQLLVQVGKNDALTEHKK
jgi:hypothetical protein